MTANLMIRNTQSPGDIVVLSAAIRDLHIAHPGKYATAVNVSPGAEHIFFNNPNVRRIIKGRGKEPGWRQFVAHYPLIKRCNQERKHFLWGFGLDMNKRLKTNIRLTKFQPDLHISEAEARTPLIEPPYWVFLSGGKKDFRTKIWSQQYWQRVIDATRDKIRWVQCGGGSSNHIEHIPKRGIHANMVAKTSLRDFMRLIYHADGVVCVVTAAMHIAAGFNKPCVVIAGGREPWWWEAYTEENRLLNMRQVDPNWTPPPGDDFMPHKFLHTMGKLSCCKDKGCWKSKLKKSSVCKHVVNVGGQRLPKCKAMIEPEQVIDSIFDYYRDGAIAKRGAGVLAKKQSVFVVRCDTAADRVAALREAKAEGADWIAWSENGTALNDLFSFEHGIAAFAVHGRIYRTKSGGYYPHPSCFVAPTSLLKDGERFTDFFAGLPPEQFKSLMAADIPSGRPEVT